MECLDMMAARHVVYTEYLDWKRFPDDASSNASATSSPISS
jgi:hypothetical protein